jgi:hypothetical protein
VVRPWSGWCDTCGSPALPGEGIGHAAQKRHGGSASPRYRDIFPEQGKRAAAPSDWRQQESQVRSERDLPEATLLAGRQRRSGGLSPRRDGNAYCNTDQCNTVGWSLLVSA